MDLCNILPLLNRVPQINNHCISTSWKRFNIEVYSRSTWFGVIRKGCQHKFGNSPPPPTTCPDLSILGWPPTLALSVRTQEWHYLKDVNNSQWRVKKLIVLFESNVKTFEWRQYSKWCHYIAFHTFSTEYKQNENFIYSHTAKLS